MRRPNSITLLSFVFLFAMNGSIVRGAVPGAQLEFIASKDNLVFDKDWQNFGIAGGKMPGGFFGIPAFEPAGGGEPARFTAMEERKIFGGPPAFNPIIHLEDWTFEIVLKRNGPGFGDTHHVAGFHVVTGEGDIANALDFTWDGERGQWIMLGFTEKDTGKMFIGLKGVGGAPQKAAVHQNIVDIGLNKWHHILFSYKNSTGRLEVWKDGVRKEVVKEKHNFATHVKGEPVDMKYMAIFTGADELGGRAVQTFNGSIHLVRLYDRVLTEAEIQQNLSVEPANKLTTTWGRVKTGY